MRTTVLAFASAIAILSHNAVADDPPALPPTPVAPQAAPAPPAAALPKEQLDHLKTAAEHLAKAGRKDEADKLREHVAAIESGQAAALLTKKEKELDALVAEVEQLRKLTRRQPQILLSFQIFEASRARLKDANIPNIELVYPRGGVKHAKSGPIHDSNAMAVENSAAVKEVIEALRKKELIKVLAEPILATVSGRQVLFNSGGEFPVILPQPQGTTSVEFKQYGTRIEALPVLVGDGKLRIQVRASVSELDAARGISINGMKVPGLRGRAVDTAAELRFGEVLVLNGPPQARVETQKDAKGKAREVNDEIEMLVVITPEQTDPQETAILPNPIGTGHGSYFRAPAAAKATHPNRTHDFYIPVPTAAKATDETKRK